MGARDECGTIKFVIGYVSARLYKFFGGLCWKTNVLVTALFCPGIVVSVFLVLNVVLSALHSSMAVSFTTILALLAMWLLVSMPLSMIGAFFGFRKDVSAEMDTYLGYGAHFLLSSTFQHRLLAGYPLIV
ncbi:unnamed protein product [Dibothriocephalus latus]|uniref:Transmembrane 9 superfamily member n=1 Tax=Dibothriocephalus latus TaxID=60516 RepID=A0A3P7MRF0_DIBLA|nr:unnamed protein product [Dibothriocephalus latus]